MIRYAVTALYLGSIVLCWPDFRRRIPNGSKVPISPCIQQSVFLIGKFHDKHDQTVGHFSVPVLGKPDLNLFGEDFKKIILYGGGNWTTLCEIDSDKDGMTNGEELGDKNCTWTEGTGDPEQKAISHPGFHNNCSMMLLFD